MAEELRAGPDDPFAPRRKPPDAGDPTARLSAMRALDKATRRGLAIVLCLLVIGCGTLAAGLWWAFGRPAETTVTQVEPPLIRADTTPWKEKPRDAGGMTVPHQDVLVFDRFDPDRSRVVRAERLLPPPEEPLPPPAPILAAPPAPVSPAPSGQGGTTSADETQSRPAVTLDAAIAALLQSSLPPSAQAPPFETAAPGDGAQTTPLRAEIGALPPPRPPTAGATPPAGSTSGAALRQTRVQLGSLSSAEGATSEWARLSRRFPQALEKLSPTVTAVRVQERMVYRLTAGPVDEARANAICETLRSGSAACIVLRP